MLRRSIGHLLVGLAGLALLGLALAAVTQQEALTPDGTGRVPDRTVILVVMILGTASLLHGAASLAAMKLKISLPVVLGVAVVARLVLLFGGPVPVLEGDLPRQQLDARLVNAGGNPWAFTPAQLAGADTAWEALLEGTERQRLEAARVAAAGSEGPVDLAGIAAPHQRSHRSALSHWAGAVAQRLQPDSGQGFAYLLLVADAFSVFLLLVALRAMALPLTWILVYAWCPLLLVEAYCNLAVDPLVLLGISGVVAGIACGRKRILALPVALAAAVRPVFFLLGPALGRRLGAVGLLAVVLLTAIPYAGFAARRVTAEQVVAGHLHVWRHVEYNSAVENGLRSALKPIPVRPEGGWSVFGVEVLSPGQNPAPLIAKAVCGLILLGIVAFVAFRRRPERLVNSDLRGAALSDLFLVLGALIFLGPVLQPRHALWLLPVLVLRPSPSWILLPGLVSLSYLTHLNGPLAADVAIPGTTISFRAVEWGGFVLIWVLDRLWRPVLDADPADEEDAGHAGFEEVEYADDDAYETLEEDVLAPLAGL